ncbi:flagellar filament capping protein FliD [Massilia dura]|uniref:Flagellar hook-associated protein 2 n=1 Tax=Pseudoduganella dura TaxID=321982 RepID=A0A6I3XMN0_9BURK|nr:flagellar filament capping protein FliD [Pseudoduganella dura]MUI15663.1 flagellar filament capping protein FliD [Pseudoduganella dura]GGX81483.1 flagellar hook-associated protein 2 [Pseudoduganella dura]
MALNSPTYDPKSTATQLATAYISGRQSILTNQNTVATATEKGLTTLKSAMSAFESAMSSLSLKKSMVSTSATFSSTVGTATATSAAVAGTYSFVVQDLATANQAQYSGLSDATPMTEAGKITVTVGDTSFEVDLATANTSGDTELSVKEMAAAINAAAGSNGSKVTASTVSVGGVPTLVMTASDTGAANVVSIDASALPPGALQDALSDTATNRKELVAAKDAVVFLGGAGGLEITQASNTFDVIDGVSMTFTKVSTDPVTLTVATDNSGTAANMQSFVDGWNKLVSTLKTLTDAGDAASGTSAGVFHADAGIKALQTRMQTVLRQKVDGLSLVNFGISGQRDGTLTLDTARLNKAVALNPETLDKLMGSNSMTTPSGLMGDLDKLTDQWTDTTEGQIGKRRDVNSKLQSTLLDRQSRLDQQYETAYIRYLNQFTTLQTLQAQMESNTSIFDALFAKDD